MKTKQIKREIKRKQYKNVVKASDSIYIACALQCLGMCGWVSGTVHSSIIQAYHLPQTTQVLCWLERTQIRRDKRGRGSKTGQKKYTKTVDRTSTYDVSGGVS